MSWSCETFSSPHGSPPPRLKCPPSSASVTRFFCFFFLRFDRSPDLPQPPTPGHIKPSVCGRFSAPLFIHPPSLLPDTFRGFSPGQSAPRRDIRRPFFYFSLARTFLTAFFSPSTSYLAVLIVSLFALSPSFYVIDFGFSHAFLRRLLLWLIGEARFLFFRLSAPPPLPPRLVLAAAIVFSPCKSRRRNRSPWVVLQECPPMPRLPPLTQLRTLTFSLHPFNRCADLRLSNLSGVCIVRKPNCWCQAGSLGVLHCRAIFPLHHGPSTSFFF